MEAQNLYLINYIGKLEFLLNQELNGRKKQKDGFDQHLAQIMRVLSQKPSISKDSKHLLEYLKFD